MKKTTVIILIACLLAVLPQQAGAQSDSTSVGSYTTEHPLVYEDAWDLWPYVFLNESGEPDGYNIDLLKMIFKGLNIPYIIKLKPTLEAQKDLENGVSDLMFRMDSHFSQGDYAFSKNIVQLFTHSIVAPRDQEVVIKKSSDITKYPVIVHDGSFSHNYLKRNGWDQKVIPEHDMKETIQKVSTEGKGIILWNTMSLKWLLRKYQMNNLQMMPVDIPYGEYKFISKDRHLLAQIDSMLTILRADEQLVPIQNKWFYPERKESGIPDWIWELIAGLALVSLFVVGYYLFYKYRERGTTKDVRKSNERLSLVLQTSGVSFWTYRVATQTFTWMGSDGQSGRDFTSLEFSRRYHPEDFLKLTEGLKQIIDGKVQSLTFDILAKESDSDQSEDRNYTITLSVLRRDKDNRPSTIICSRSDMTQEYLRQRKIQETMMRYRSIFESAMVDMMYFDEHGILYDINDKAGNNFGIPREKIAEKGLTVADIMGIPDLKAEDIDNLYVTRLIDADDAVIRVSGRQLKGLIYYELQLVPVHDENGKLLGIYGTGRAVTEVVRTYHQRQANILQLQKANDEVKEHIRNIDYVLNVGGIRIIRYLLGNHTLVFYKEANQVEHVLTQTRALSLADDQYRRKVLQIFQNMDNLSAQPIHAEIKTILRLKGGTPLFLQFNIIPIHGADGSITEYFGMGRDISDLKAVEEELAKETVRAQEVEVIKNAFLHNMSYEIRTPLNTVVGFSELFQMEHSEEDETVFINEIKTSSAKLLRLINDILFLSRLDADMITINPQPIDFATIFESRCEVGWGNDKKPGVNYVVQSPYRRLVVAIDDSNLTIIIQKIIENAVQHTEHGTVLARYDYIGDRLIVSVEDTGSGIPEEKQKNIFDRFVTGGDQGAGLGLSICHELTRHMGGRIDLTSIEGKGTTVWFSIPCKATEIERI